MLARPQASMLPTMYRKLGLDYDDRVLPSIMNEVKGVVRGRGGMGGTKCGRKVLILRVGRFCSVPTCTLYTSKLSGIEERCCTV